MLASGMSAADLSVRVLRLAACWSAVREKAGAASAVKPITTLLRENMLERIWVGDDWWYELLFAGRRCVE